MKNKINVGIITLVIGILFLFTSCAKDEDAVGELPTATISLPVNNQYFLRGNTILLSADFQSQVGLKECWVFLKEDTSLKGWDDPWTPEEVITLSGNEDSIEKVVLFEDIIPSDIKSTTYTLTLFVRDVNLNYSTYEVPITIE